MFGIKGDRLLFSKLVCKSPQFLVMPQLMHFRLIFGAQRSEFLESPLHFFDFFTAFF